MLRTIGGLAAGAVAGFLTIWLIDMIGHLIYPVRSDITVGNSEQAAALIRGLPAGAQAFVVAAWFAGAVVGGALAHRISRRRWTGWAVAALVAVAAILNILMIPHPEWMQVGAVIAPLIGGLLAAHLGRPKASRPAV